MYEYTAELVRVIDGDTVRLRVNVGFHMTFEQNFRLNGIDTPEIRGEERPEGLVAKDVVTELLGQGPIQIRTYKPDKYGRWLADIFTLVKDQTVFVNEWLVENQYAQPYHGGKK